MKLVCNECGFLSTCTTVTNKKYYNICINCIPRLSTKGELGICRECQQLVVVSDSRTRMPISEFLINPSLACPCKSTKSTSAVYPYDYKGPSTIIKLRDGDNSPSIGLEIEIEMFENKDISEDQMMSIDKFRSIIKKPWFYYKHDGSLLRGLEIVTIPMTYEYIKKNKDAIIGHIESIGRNTYSKQYDIKSRTTKTCGLHIHIGINKFTSLTLYKVMLLIHNNLDIIIIHSGRIYQDMKRWANLIDKNNMIGTSLFKNFNHHSIINTYNGNTTEFRFFKGTTSKSEIMAAIQLCLILRDIAVNTSLREINNIKEKEITSYILESNYDELKNKHTNLLKIKENMEDVHNNFLPQGNHSTKSSFGKLVI